MSYHRTFIGGTAVATDIAEGKTATVNDIELTGTKAQNSGVHLLVVPPTGISDSSFSPLTEHGALIIAKPGMTLGAASTWVLGTNGFSTNTNSFAQFIGSTSGTGLGSYTTKRKYELWGRVADVALTGDEGVRVLFDLANNSFENYWVAALVWNSGTSVFNLNLVEITATVQTTRASVAFSAALDLPAEFHLVLYEQGDAIMAQAVMFETDAPTDDEAVSCAYSIASRPHKSNTYFNFSNNLDPETDWLIRGCMISDIS